MDLLDGASVDDVQSKLRKLCPNAIISIDALCKVAALDSTGLPAWVELQHMPYRHWHGGLMMASPHLYHHPLRTTPIALINLSVV